MPTLPNTPFHTEAQRQAIEARDAARAVCDAAADIRDRAEALRHNEEPDVQALSEAAVFHASRAADRARSNPAFAKTHLRYAKTALAQAENW